MRYLTLLLVVFTTGGLLAQLAPSPHLHVDQFGYLPGAEKVAVLSDPLVGFNSAESFSPGTTLEVRDATTDAVVFSGQAQVWNGGATHTQSGDRGWWFDFSALTTPGSYYVIDVASGERSARFDVSPQVYDQVLYHALRMFYYNRANTAKPQPFAEAAWTDAESFMYPGQDSEARYLYDTANVNLYRELSGGWFDAGDYNKYVTFAEEVVHDLLSAYQENPQAFQASSNIPGSNNALPDVLDEVIWELEWLKKMTNPDGSTHIKMGNISYQVNGESPPSDPGNDAQRYYGPTCTAASLANAGMFAHAATVLQNEPGQQSYASNLQSLAASCFAYALPFIQAGTLETNCDDGQIKAGDADRSVDEQITSAVTAAWYLWSLTADPAYESFLEAYIPQVTNYVNYYWSPYNATLNTALLDYMADPASDAAIVDRLEQGLQNTIDNEPFFGFDENADLYRGHIPDWAYHWGSNNPKARMAHLNEQAARAGYVHAMGQGLARKASEQLHYFHGINPLGLVMLSNMNAHGAERSINELYHGWFWNGTPWDNALTSQYGPAPGYITGGPNDYYEDHPSHDPSLVPPVGQPAQKSYLDDNNTIHSTTGSDNAIYAINEPAIYYQSAYVRLLANYAGVAGPLPAELLSFAAERTNDGVLATWEVGAETNVDTYTLERSADGQVFSDLMVRQPTGAGSSYSALDAQPMTGINYYRLRIADRDGATQYSAIVQVEVLSSTHIPPFGKTVLAPNPAGAFVLLQAEDLPANTTVSIYDGLGRRVRSVAVNAVPLRLEVSDLPAGSYTLKLTSPHGAATHRLVVSKS